MKWKQQVVVLIVYINLALLKILKTIKILQQIQVYYTRVFNITFIGFLSYRKNSLQTIWISKQNKKIALLKGPGN